MYHLHRYGFLIFLLFLLNSVVSYALFLGSSRHSFHFFDHPASEVIIRRVSSGLVATVGGIFDVFVALIICVYILNSKILLII